MSIPDSTALRLRKYRKRGRTRYVSSVAVGRCGIYVPEMLRKHIPTDYVEVYYDEEAKVIALKPTRSEAEFKLVKENRWRGGKVAVKGLIDRLSLKPGRYPAKWDEGLGMLIIYYGVEGFEE